jgi:hypothetical protein
MHPITHASISWATSNGIKYPGDVYIHCPFCSKMVHIRMSSHTELKNGRALNGRCPACKQEPQFIYFYPQNPSESGEFFVYPIPTNIRNPIADLTTLGLSERLNKSYLEAINSFNNGIWGATGNAARRTLEGIVKGLLPDGTPLTNLARMLTLIPDDRLKKPVLEIADSLRLVGNPSSHFDDDFDPTSDSAYFMLELLDALIEYLYIVPLETELLKAQVAKKEN